MNIVQIVILFVFFGNVSSFVYNETLSRDLVYHSAISYCDTNLKVGKWDCSYCKYLPGFNLTHIIYNEKMSTFGYAGYDSISNYSLVTFEGSDDLTAWIYNLQIGKSTDLVSFYGDESVRVHSGFLKLYDGIRDQLFKVVSELKEPIIFTGHSQGSSLSSLAIVDLNKDYLLYTFGSPRVGNDAFAKKLKNHFRVTHSRDVVVHLPYRWMGYAHSEPEVWYPKDDLEYKCCMTENCGADSKVPALSVEDHLHYLQIPIRGGC